MAMVVVAVMVVAVVAVAASCVSSNLSSCDMFTSARSPKKTQHQDEIHNSMRLQQCDSQSL